MGAAGLGATGLSLLQFDPTAARASTGVHPLAAGVTTGLSYRTVGYADFFPYNSGVFTSRIKGDYGAYPSLVAAAMVATISLPVGAIVQEVVVSGFNSRSSRSFDISLVLDDVMTVQRSVVGNASIPANGTDVVQATMTGIAPLVVGPDTILLIETDTQTNDGSNQIRGARIGYIPPPTFVPITPARVYDSRQPAYGDPGVLQPKTSRVISVKDGRAENGTVNATGIVPVGATAVAYNLTVSGSTGPNFLSVGPGNVAAVVASAINFPGGDDRANGGVVKLDPMRQIRVFNGDQSGSTHVIVDVTGYYF